MERLSGRLPVRKPFDGTGIASNAAMEVEMDRDKTRQRHRVTIEESREEADAPDGYEPSASSYTDETGTTDLGVNEPVVPPGLRGAAESCDRDNRGLAPDS
jgi:hypothetical protein